MISWCCYCQTYQGQIHPFDDFSMTHGICPECLAKGRDHLRGLVSSTLKISAFYKKLREAAIIGLENSGTSLEQILQDGAELGIKDIDLCVGMIQPILYEIGELWRQGKVTVEEEHRFTAFSTDLVRVFADSRKEKSRKVGRDSGLDLLLVGAEGNIHFLGLQIIELALGDLGISTKVITESLCNDEIISTAIALKSRILGISISLPEQIQSMFELAKKLDGHPFGHSIKILVGGVALNEHDAAIAMTGNIKVAPRNMKELAQLILRELALPIKQAG